MATLLRSPDSTSRGGADSMTRVDAADLGQVRAAPTLLESVFLATVRIRR